MQLCELHHKLRFLTCLNDPKFTSGTFCYFIGLAPDKEHFDQLTAGLCIVSNDIFLFSSDILLFPFDNMQNYQKEKAIGIDIVTISCIMAGVSFPQHRGKDFFFFFCLSLL